MIIKAYIVSVPENGKNDFKVRIPFLEGNSPEPAIFSALLCCMPGESNGYSVGDCVFIAFENNKKNTAIILGKLYTGEVDSTTSLVVDNITVKTKANLPSSTKIGIFGEKEFFKLSQLEPTEK